jgi:hypothetical protein
LTSLCIHDAIRCARSRIKTDAIAEYAAADLIVSPDHPLFIDGVPISAGKLVNGEQSAWNLNQRKRILLREH